MPSPARRTGTSSGGCFNRTPVVTVTVLVPHYVGESGSAGPALAALEGVTSATSLAVRTEELRRLAATGGRYGLAGICIGVGPGLAVVVGNVTSTSTSSTMVPVTTAARSQPVDHRW